MHIQITMIPAWGWRSASCLIVRPLSLVLWVLLLVVLLLATAVYRKHLPVEHLVSLFQDEDAVVAIETSVLPSRYLLEQLDTRDRLIEHLRAAHREEQKQLNAMAVRLGELQGNVWQLESLSALLLEATELETPEFDEEESPGQGGPAPMFPMPDEGSSGALVPEDVFEELLRLEQSLQMVEKRLELMRSLSMERKFIKRIIPTGSVAQGWYSSRFGMRIDPFSGRREFHGGLDISDHRGTPIHAVAAGIVTWAGRKGAYGKLVEISHGDVYVTRYGHNSKNLVTVGEWVEQGQVIARMGSTGRSTGVHVHFEIEIGGKLVNPVNYITRAAAQL